MGPATDKPVIAVHLSGSNSDNAVFKVYPNTGPILSSSWEGEGFSHTFHSIAMEWRKDAVSFYVNRVEVQCRTRKIPKTRAYVELTIATGGDIAGPVSGWTNSPYLF